MRNLEEFGASVIVDPYEGLNVFKKKQGFLGPGGVSPGRRIKDNNRTSRIPLTNQLSTECIDETIVGKSLICAQRWLESGKNPNEPEISPWLLPDSLRYHGFGRL